MKKISLIGLVLFFVGHIYSQQLYQDYSILKDSLRYGYGKNDLFPGGSQGFTLVLPDAKKEVKGTVLILDDDRVNLSDTANIYQPANARGFAALYISTGIPVDLYFSERSLVYVDSLIKEVFSPGFEIYRIL